MGMARFFNQQPKGLVNMTKKCHEPWNLIICNYRPCPFPSLFVPSLLAPHSVTPPPLCMPTLSPCTCGKPHPTSSTPMPSSKPCLSSYTSDMTLQSSETILIHPSQLPSSTYLSHPLSYLFSSEYEL